MERVAGWLERLAAGAGEAAAAAMAGSGDLAAAAAAAAASTESAQEELQEVLLPLVIGLRRMGRLPAVLRQHKEASVAWFKDFLRWGHVACHACCCLQHPATSPLSCGGWSTRPDMHPPDMHPPPLPSPKQPSHRGLPRHSGWRGRPGRLGPPASLPPLALPAPRAHQHCGAPAAAVGAGAWLSAQ